MSKLILILLSYFLTGFSEQVSAQANPCLDRTIPANVYTARGEGVTGLVAGNFKASIKGKPIQVKAVAYDSGPRRILIMIDVSGSMTEQGRLKWGLKFAEDLISSASTQDTLALLTYSSKIEDSLALGESGEALLAEIEKLQDKDGGHGRGMHKLALEDAILNGLTLLKTPNLGDAICIVTDSSGNGNQSHKSKVRDLLESDGIRVYEFLPTWRIASLSAGFVEAPGTLELRGLATATGGDYLLFLPGQARLISMPTAGPYEVSPSDADELSRAAQAFHHEVSIFIKLDLRLPEPLSKAFAWDLEVVDAAGQPNKNLKVVYPHQLAPCTPPESP